MTTQQDEHFSALLDDELDSANRDIMLNRLMTDEQAKQRWYRYHLISDTLQAKLPDKIDLQFSASVMAALADEPAILAPKQTTTHHYTPTMKHRAAGFAIAATVAVVAVLGVQNLNEPPKLAQQDTMPSSSQFERIASQQSQIAQSPLVPQPLTPAQVAQIQPPQNANGSPAMTVSSTQSTLLPADNQNAEFDPRLHQYIVNHNQNISGGQLQSIMPYVRIVVSPTVVNQQGQQ